MRRIPEVPHVDEPYEDTNTRNDLREHVSKIVQLALQRSLLTDLRGNRLVDIADGRILTGENNDGARAPINDCCTLFKVNMGCMTGSCSVR